MTGISEGDIVDYLHVLCDKFIWSDFFLCLMCINMSNQGVVNLMISQVIVVFGLPGLRFMEETTL